MPTASCSTETITQPAMRFRLIPAGLFRANDGRPQGMAGWFMGSDSARRIIAELTAKKNDVLIDYEHQSLKGDKAPAAGWFKSLEWREGDGLYVTDARWTREAAEMLKKLEYRYISPAFHFDQATGNVLSIISAAITNTPALDGLTDLAAATRQITTGQAAMSEKDQTTMKQVFGADIFEKIAQERANEARDIDLAVPPPGVSAKDHASLQAIFGKTYHMGS